MAGIQSLAIYLFYTGRLDKLEIKESGAAVFSQISIIVLEKKKKTNPNSGELEFAQETRIHMF